MKICAKCGLEKELNEFGKLKCSKDGLNYSCKVCSNNRSSKYRQDNPEKILKLTRDWCKKNPEWVYNRHKKYRLDNTDKLNENKKKWLDTNPEKRKLYRENYKPRKQVQRKERRQTDVVFKLVNNVRSRIYKYLKILNITKKNTTFDIVGCTPEELKIHIENQFTEGMLWGNHGQFGWHIDHILPLDSAKTEDDIYKLCHYTNLQPLWWKDNLKTGTKIL